ncbi:uncharacterized protein VP01_363g1, partial [Puccinia sorghi]
VFMPWASSQLQRSPTKLKIFWQQLVPVFMPMFKQTQEPRPNGFSPTNTTFWLGKPLEKGKKNISFVIHLLKRDIALKIKKSGLFLQNELLDTLHNVVRTLHSEINAIETSDLLLVDSQNPFSKKTVQHLDERFSHPPWSNSCPLLKQEIQNQKRWKWNS